MADAEIVKRALNLCKYDPDPGQPLKYIHSCVHCPYWDDGIAPRCAYMYTEAIELIDELQEQVDMKKPVKPIAKDPIEITARYGFDCECGSPLLQDQPFCGGCGRKVEW